MMVEGLKIKPYLFGNEGYTNQDTFYVIVDIIENLDKTIFN